MFDRHIHKDTQYIPYCKEVTHNYNMPTTTEDLCKLNNLKNEIKGELIETLTAMVKPLEAEAVVTRWRSLTAIADETRITIKHRDKSYCTEFLTESVGSRNFTKYDYLKMIKEKTISLVSDILSTESVRVTERGLSNELY